MKDRKFIIILTILAILSILFFLFYNIDPDKWQFYFSLRIPKVIALILTGVAITFSTVIFQTISNNRILTPSIMGFDSLYLFLQTVIVFFLGSTSHFITNNMLNFLITCGIMMFSSVLFYKIIFVKGKQNVLFLLLLGTVLSTFFRSISSFLQMVIDPNEFLVIQNKMFASFNNIQTDLILIVLVAFILLIPFIIDDFKFYDILALGRDPAINLGLNYARFIQKSLLVITILVSLSTALVGPITFLGLIVVNLCRERLEDYHHTTLILASSLLSIIFLVGGQFIVERIFHFNTTLSVIINFIGGIYFIILLLKENRI